MSGPFHETGLAGLTAGSLFFFLVCLNLNFIAWQCRRYAVLSWLLSLLGRRSRWCVRVQSTSRWAESASGARLKTIYAVSSGGVSFVMSADLLGTLHLQVVCAWFHYGLQAVRVCLDLLLTSPISLTWQQPHIKGCFTGASPTRQTTPL